MKSLHLIPSLLLLSSGAFAASALSGGVSGTGTNQSAIPLPYRTLEVDAGMSYYPGSELGFQDESGRAVKEAGADRFDMAGAIGYGILPFLEGNVMVPYYRDQDLSGKQFKGMGDIRASLKFNYPPYPHKKGFEISLLAQLDLPTATSAGEFNGYTRHAYYTVSGTGDDSTRNAFGARGATVSARMLTTANLGAIEGFVPVLFHLNWGAAFSGASSQNAFLLGGGAEITPYPAVSIFWNFNSEVSITQSSRSIPIFTHPFASSAGLQLNFPKAHLEVYGGVHFVMNSYPDTLYSAPHKSKAGSPNYLRYPDMGWFGGLSTNFSFLPKDPDGDGIKGELDRCPMEAEDADRFDDEDGCPELDNDKDGILDSKDKCPMVAEDVDEFEDTDGCPEPDNDLDSIPDTKDKCPIAPEDRDGFQDEDGCTDPDNDTDGILDEKDKCPAKVEDQDGFQDEDGCPDSDNDNDGIPDNLDRCPNQTETVNGVEDGDGCPDSQPTVNPGTFVPKTGAQGPGVSVSPSGK